MNKDTVILYGTNTFTRHLIDWNRDDCEYWAWNEIGSLKDDRPGYWAKRIDLLIQIHATPIWRNHTNLNHGRQQTLEDGTLSNSHYDWLKRPHEFPIFMQDHYDDVPSSVKYPLDEIINDLLPSIKRDYGKGIEQVKHFTSSCADAIALAIYLGKKQIELVGIEMTSDTEYVRQRDGVTFWLGVAVGKGINIVIHSPLFMNNKLYGYTGEIVIQKQEFEMSVRKLDNLVEEAKEKVFESRGRSQAMLDAFLKSTNQNDLKRILPSMIQAMNDVNERVAEYGILMGRHQENTRYLNECNELINAAGGEKALEALMNNIPYPLEKEMENVPEKV